jgi:hypothetical protein
VGDFDGDGKLDLATVNQIGATVSVLRGNGNGTFGPAVNYGVAWGPLFLAMGDFNGDGVSDLLTVNRDSHSLSVLLNAADGTAPGRGSAGLTPRSQVVLHGSAQFAFAALAGADHLAAVPLSHSWPVSPAEAAMTNPDLPTSSGAMRDAFFAAWDEDDESHLRVRERRDVRPVLDNRFQSIGPTYGAVLDNPSWLQALELGRNL